MRTRHSSRPHRQQRRQPLPSRRSRVCRRHQSARHNPRSPRRCQTPQPRSHLQLLRIRIRHSNRPHRQRRRRTLLLRSSRVRQRHQPMRLLPHSPLEPQAHPRHRHLRPLLIRLCRSRPLQPLPQLRRITLRLRNRARPLPTRLRPRPTAAHPHLHHRIRRPHLRRPRRITPQ
jgi:hypothetical protein